MKKFKKLLMNNINEIESSNSYIFFSIMQRRSNNINVMTKNNIRINCTHTYISHYSYKRNFR